MHLYLTDWHSATQWRWELRNEQGNFLADYQVNLDAGAEEHEGLENLAGWLDKWRLLRGDTQSLEVLGTWLGTQLFAGLRDAILKNREFPATVIPMHLPVEAQNLVYYPFELAHLDGTPLARLGIRFIYQIGADPAGKPKPAPQPSLRVLAVFSLPDGQTPLNLRRERYELKRLLEEIGQTHNGAIELRELQYGATRQTLSKALQDGNGWDMIHFSGHGHNGLLVLENDAGETDIINTAELQKLLLNAKRRLKLLTLSACHSGANIKGSDQLAKALLSSENTAAQGEATDFPSLAQQLAGKLDCAVLAMRYAVGDWFAITLGNGLYRALLEDHQPLPGALQLALADALEEAAPPLSAATPILFGARSAELALPLPPRTEGFHQTANPLAAYFPLEPVRFVGRLQPMLQASRALAPNSRSSGVLIHGMAGAGKTSCALELAWRHEHQRFTGWVWHKAPESGDEVRNALLDFLTDMENQLVLGPGALTANLDKPELFRNRTLPQLKALLKQRALCIVLDNLEGLLSADDTWRDENWSPLLHTLLEHGGHSRLVLTSRRIPKDLAGHPSLLRLPIHALSLGETVLLLRELPNSCDLFQDEAGRGLLQRVLLAVQGHPKLLEMADVLAADRVALVQRLDQMEQAVGGATLQAFFEQGVSAQQEIDFLRQLQAWTENAYRALSPTARQLLDMLAGMEEADRVAPVVSAVWPQLAGWEDESDKIGDETALPVELTELLTKLAQGLGGEEQPDPAQLARAWRAAQHRSERTQRELIPTLAELQGAALVDIRRDRRQAGKETDIPDSYALHPAVAETIRELAAQESLGDVDRILCEFWSHQFAFATQNEQQGMGGQIPQAARRAIPYLLRRQAWRQASGLLEQLLHRDEAPATLAYAIPLLRTVADASAGTKGGLESQGLLARALFMAGHTKEAETALREVMAQAAAEEQFRLATTLASELFSLLHSTGRLDEALVLSEQKMDYTHRAGLGPWSRLAGETLRLQVLLALGRVREVLNRLQELLPQLRELPENSAAQESAFPWNVRETLLNVGCIAAIRLEEWKQTLEFNQEITQSRQARGADKLDLAKTRYNDYGALLHLKRYGECRKLLEECRRAFADARDYANLGKVYAALADLEDKLDHPDKAVDFERGALRYAYLSGNPESCATGHNNLARDLRHSDANSEEALAQLLAAAVLYFQMGSGHLQSRVSILATFNLSTHPPAFAELADAMEKTEGVRFRELFARLPARTPDGDAAIAAVWEMALKRRGQSSAGPDMTRILEKWQLLLADMAAVALGDDAPRASIEELLPKLEEKGWHIDAAVRAIWDGERDAEKLVADLDDSDATLVKHVLELIAQGAAETPVE
jgi:tetratricopeptide (TPR) repeat protein